MTSAAEHVADLLTTFWGWVAGREVDLLNSAYIGHTLQSGCRGHTLQCHAFPQSCRLVKRERSLKSVTDISMFETGDMYYRIRIMITNSSTKYTWHASTWT